MLQWEFDHTDELHKYFITGIDILSSIINLKMIPSKQMELLLLCPVEFCRYSFSSLFDQQRKTIVHLFSRCVQYRWNFCFNLLTYKIHKWLFWKQKEISMAINFWKQFWRVKASSYGLVIDRRLNRRAECVVRWILSNNGRCTLCSIPLSLRLYRTHETRIIIMYYVICDLHLQINLRMSCAFLSVSASTERSFADSFAQHHPQYLFLINWI